MKAYSQDLRNKVIQSYYEDAKTVSDLSVLFRIGVNTIKDWIHRYETTGNYTSKQGVGCGRVCKYSDKNKILQYIKENPDANGIEIRDAVAPDLHMNTFYDTLHRMQITYKKRAKI